MKTIGMLINQCINIHVWAKIQQIIFWNVNYLTNDAFCPEWVDDSASSGYSDVEIVTELET